MKRCSIINVMNKQIILFIVAVVVIAGAGFLIFKFFTPMSSVTPPSVTVDIKQNVENYLRENISTLSPVQPVLDGTWYVTSVTTDVGKNSGVVEYEDGHIQEIKNFSYTTNEKGEIASLTIIESNNPVACTQEAKLCPDGSAVGRSGPNCEFASCPVPSSKKSGISGVVTLSPTCPVERIPPDPNCAPKPYATTIGIIRPGWDVAFPQIQSDANGAFSVQLEPGTYTLQAHGGNLLPRCGDVSVTVKSKQYTKVEISCDTGIR